MLIRQGNNIHALISAMHDAVKIVLILICFSILEVAQAV